MPFCYKLCMLRIEWGAQLIDCLANCRPLNVSVHCCLGFVQLVQEASIRAYI